jgi:hypothetical protein
MFDARASPIRNNINRSDVRSWKPNLCVGSFPCMYNVQVLLFKRSKYYPRKCRLDVVVTVYKSRSEFMVVFTRIFWLSGEDDRLPILL